MPNNSGYNATLSLGGAAIARASRAAIQANNALVDVTDLSHVVAQPARGITTVNVTGEAGYKLQSGRAWTVSVGAGYTGAELDGGSIDMRVQDIDTSDAADWIAQRVPGPVTCTATLNTKYAATTHFMTMVKAAASSNTSLAMTITDSTASTVIAGTVSVSDAGWEAPPGAVTQSFGCQFKTITSVGASFRFGSMAFTAATSEKSTVCIVKDGAGTTKLSGLGYIMGAGLTWDKGAAVRQTVTHSIHSVVFG